MDLSQSKHNIFAPIKDSENSVIINLLSQQADILSPKKAEEWKQNVASNQNEFIEKGYLVDKKEEARNFKLKYLDFVEQRDADELQLFFVPNYACNFACKYCYQDEYTNPTLFATKEIVDSFFNYITSEFADRRKYITLFGGEPLLNTASQKEMIRHFIARCNENNLTLAIVSNGYTIAEYLDILKTANLREIQITVDGTAETHDKRRFLKGGGSSFARISDGIDLLLKNNIPVNLRMVVDKENIDQLPLLAQYAIDQKWTSNSLFKTQLGRNYELHHCQEDNVRLFTRVGLYQKIYELVSKFPHILEFHKPAFSISKYLFENGELPEPLFDSCPGCKTEWAFDFNGKIYSCTATVGKEGEELGSFYPEITRNQSVISEWEERDVTAIPECKECPVQLACGGGCAAVAKNRTGKILSPDCRPVKELLGLGVGYYFKDSE